jgi:hypothetical protein
VLDTFADAFDNFAGTFGRAYGSILARVSGAFSDIAGGVNRM